MICSYCGYETAQNPCAVCGASLDGAPVSANVTEVTAVAYSAPDGGVEYYAEQTTAVYDAYDTTAPAAYSAPNTAQPAWPQQQQAYSQPPQAYQPQPAAYAPTPQPAYAPAPPQPAYAAQPAPYYPQAPAYSQPYYPAAAAYPTSYPKPIPKRLHDSVGGSVPMTLVSLLALIISVGGPLISVYWAVQGTIAMATGLVSGMSISSFDALDQSFNIIGVLLEMIPVVGGGALLLLLGLFFSLLPPIFLLVAAPSTRSAPRRARVMLILAASFGGVGSGLCTWGIYSAFAHGQYMPAPYSYAGHIMLASTILLLLLCIIGAVVLGKMASKSDALYRAER